ncbi:ABC transporter permease subunit [Streptomyces triticirhizae]|uniref:ABC transporter permease n=1 Tax=Streptomyces triticirhizae TaxID=2483353 RepID=A0A3M2LZV4_9ACTN|nr:ABC transporter permease subunit [Streptomyces triticirhizae]RMI42999.1 ABC transporter permease [Streptomyces triticirhizae]
MSTGTDARIHNIGYRNYTGERLGISYARRALFTHSLRGSFGLGRSARSKVLPMGLFAIMMAPAVVMVAIAAFVGLDELPIEYTSYALFMQPIVGLYVALAAPQMVSLDLRFKVTPLYFSRPIERRDYVVAKYAALCCAIFLFVALPLVLAYVGGLLADLGFAEQTRGFAQGMALSVLFALLHAALALWVASLTPRRGFGVAAVIGVLTIPYFAVTALQAVAYEQGSENAVGWIGLFSPGSLIDGIQSSFLDGRSGYPYEQTPTDGAGFALLAMAILVTVVCYLLLGRRYRKAGL